MHTKERQQSGAVSKIVLLVIFLLVAATILGIITYRMASDDNDIDPELQTTISEANCEHVDQDLCKFFASWNAAGDYSVEATRAQDGADKTYTLKNDEQDNFALSADGDKRYEVVAIGETIYVRENGGSWQQQTVGQEEVGEYREDNTLNFSEPGSEDEAAAYTAQGTEECGDRTCFRYRISTGNQGTKNIWFDDQEYRLRRITVDRDNYSYDASVSYADVSVEAPEQSAVVAEGERIAPGETEPRVLGSNNGNNDLPATGDVIDPEEYRLWLEQRGQR